MNTTSITTTPSTTGAALPGATRVGPLHLTVTDLNRSIAFYEDAIGLQLHGGADATATLGAGGEDLLVLVEEPSAQRAGRHAGLYHFALLHPSRRELARAAVRLSASRTQIEGAADHGISEAIYLRDPDANGIELAADRPRDQWPDLRNPGWDMGPKPLDVAGLLALVAGEDAVAEADPRLTIGHVHLHVGDLDQALAFYRDVIGFELMTLLPSAAFVAAGGYHHHLGVNTWMGTGVGGPPAGTVGLRHWTLLLADDAQVGELRARLDVAGVPIEQYDGDLLVRDPWGTALVIAVAAGASRPAVASW
jgi:catechol 2,3-dioxygenase